MKACFMPLLCGTLAAMFVGCASTEVVKPGQDTGHAVMALDYRDFDVAATQALESIKEEGTVDKPGGGRYVVYVGRIINKTTQKWETTQLSKSVTIALRKSGKIVVTLVPPRDEDETEAEYAARLNGGVAPELVLTGKVSERNMQYSSSKKQTEYYLELELTDPKTKLVFWEGSAPIIKRGSANSVNW